MQHIFYFIAIIVLIYEFILMTNPHAKALERIKMKHLYEKYRYVKFEMYPKELKNNSYKVILFHLPILFWIFIGIFSSQWILFLILLFSSLVFVPFNKILMKNSYIKAIHLFVISFLWFNIIIFMLINKYHLHLNLKEIIIQHLS